MRKICISEQLWDMETDSFDSKIRSLKATWNFALTGWEGAMGPRAPLRSLPEPPKHEPRRSYVLATCAIFADDR